MLISVLLAMQVWSGAESGTGSPANDYRDDRTGARVRNLTPGMAQAQVVYQTHPMWMPGMEYLIFTGEDAGKSTLHALHMKTGRVRAIAGESAGTFVLDPKGGQIICLNGDLIEAIQVKEAFDGDAKPRPMGSRPANAIRFDGGFSLDAKRDLLYAGAVLEDNQRWAILALDLASGQWRTVADVDFRVGHVQANPFVSRLVMFCHETGGDAPQRTWVFDPATGKVRPFYKETYNEWVTHEVWWGADRALFTIWPYDEEHKKLPHGVAGADLATGIPTVYAQYPAWHTHGSPDGHWLVGDDFDRNLWLIKAETRERRLLTQGHLGKGFDTHPHPSFTPDSRSVVFTSSRNGAENVFMVELPDWDSLPTP